MSLTWGIMWEVGASPVKMRLLRALLDFVPAPVGSSSICTELCVCLYYPLWVSGLFVWVNTTLIYLDKLKFNQDYVCLRESCL